ncbi:MAG: DUF4837 family protein [Bacteroidetes bacterium]|nr:DUF4837 family protein [Bacteroidota bacterium]
MQLNMFNFNRLGAVFAILTSAAIYSCSGDSGSAVLPASSGKVGEMLVVIEESYWKGEAGEAIREVFQQSIPGLSAHEPMLSIVFVSHKNFSRMFRTHRNILIADITGDPKTNSQVEMKKESWAENQLVYTFVAPDDTSFASLIKRRGQQVLDEFLKIDIERLMRRYRGMEDKQITAYLQEKHQFSMVVPKGYKIATEGEKFVWLRYERPDLGDFYQSLTFWYTDYTDTSMFSRDYILMMRDSLGKMYIPGELPNTYMSTVTFAPLSAYNDSLVDYRPEPNPMQINGQYAIELKGMWRLKHDFLGGPFISITTYDPTRNRLFTIEGSLYVPDYDKRVYIRELEAIIKTIRFQ